MARWTKSFLIIAATVSFAGTIAAQGPLPETPAVRQLEPVEPEFAGALRTELDNHHGFSGAVLVAKDAKPIFTGAYGLARRTGGVPNTLDTQAR